MLEKLSTGCDGLESSEKWFYKHEYLFTIKVSLFLAVLVILNSFPLWRTVTHARTLGKSPKNYISYARLELKFKTHWIETERK
jgi:uncharacterized membrane protein